MGSGNRWDSYGIGVLIPIHLEIFLHSAVDKLLAIIVLQFGSGGVPT